MALPYDPNGRDGDNQGPYPTRPRSPTVPRPRSQTDPGIPASDVAVTAPESGRVLPIVRGTAKVAGTIIEQYSSVVYAGTLQAPAWQISYPYSVGDRVTANSNTYVCVTSGVSAGAGPGPTGTGTNIVDGNTSSGPSHKDVAVRWNFVQIGTDIFWKPSTAYTVNGMTTRVLANGNFYVCTQSGTSAATGTGPSGTATSGITDGTCTWGYTPPGWRTLFAAAFCEGQIFGALGAWSDGYTNLKDYGAIANEGIFLAPGTPTGGGRPTWFPVPDATFADFYSDVAVLYIASLGTADRKTTNISLEIINGVGVTDTVPDENPADTAIYLLTDTRGGAGWPLGRVDTTGTLAVGVASSYRNYCTANGLLMSWVWDTQAPAMEYLGLLLAATNSDAVWTGGMLKFFPRSDQAITANGATYTPNLTPVFNLTQDDIVGVVEVTSRRSGQLAFNDYPVEYTDRAGGYVRIVVDDPDMADIDKRGTVKAGTVALPQIIAPATAIMLSRIFAQRSLKVRNTYKFRLPHRFMLLDPCDIVTLTDSVSGLSAQPVRITAIEEDQAMDGQFLFEAEDFPGSVHAAAQYTPQAGDGFRPNRGSDIGQSVVLPANTPGGTVPSSSTTRGGAVHNMWPNGSSENPPPDGVNLRSTEWAGRTIDATAYAGDFVRQLQPVINTRVGLGDEGSPAIFTPTGTIGFSFIGLLVACSPNEWFAFEAQARVTAGGPTGTNAVVEMYFLNKNKAQLVGVGSSVGAVSASWTYLNCAPQPAPAGTCYVWFVVRADINAVSAPSTIQFDAIMATRYLEASSDASSNAAALTLGAGGNVFTDIPGTSQSFTPNTASRKIKVSLALTAFAPVAGGPTGQDIRIVFGGTPTQAGVTYHLYWNTANVHTGWSFLWALPATTLGPVGTAVTVKAQVRSPAGCLQSFTMDGVNDYASMIIEEIG